MNDKIRTEIMKKSLLLFDGGFNTKHVVKIMKALYPNISIEAIEQMSESVIEMSCSFHKAVDKAGGSGWPIKELLEMTTSKSVTIDKT